MKASIEFHASIQRELPSASFGATLLAVLFDDCFMKSRNRRGEWRGSSVPNGVGVGLSS